MADPLSIAASIAGLLSLADIVFLRLSKYIKSVKNAEKEISDLCKEVNLVGGTVNMLSRLATSLEAEDESPIQGFRMHHVDGCAAILSEIVNKTKKYEDKSGGRLKKLFWPYTSSKTKEMLADLSRHKENMNLALSATSLEALLRCLAKEEERERTATAILADVRKTKEIAVRIQQDTWRRRILDFFLRYNPQSNYEMSVKLRHPRTGMWLERHSSFQQWLRTQGSRLWLSGIPGAGKTVLAGSIIGHALARSSDTVAVGFFFCDYKNETTQSPVNILGGLAYQLAIQSEKAYSMLEEYYFELHPDKELPRSPNTEDLGRTILRMFQVFEHTYIVVDGLDECGDHAEEVVEALCDIAENSDELSMALLSRDEDDIQRHLRDSEKKFLNIEIAAHTDDIIEFLTSEIERRIRSRKLVFEDHSLKAEILESLVAGAHGMFRWVACQLDHLGGCDSDEQCREALRSLPPDLPETYMRILRRVSPAKQTQIQMTLHFIAYAEPRLDIEQMREILSIPSTSQQLSPSGIIREDAIARYCSSLIRKSNDGKYFEFAHFSVQEFLTSNILQSSNLGMFHISKSHCDRLLAVRCLEYLQLDNFNHQPTATSEEITYMEHRNKKYPLYKYAAENWIFFAREQWIHSEILAQAKRLFDPQKSTQFTSWVATLVWEIWNSTFDELSREGINAMAVDSIAGIIQDSFQPLHFAATMALPEISSFLLQTSDHHETKCMLGTPIKCAVNCLCGALEHFFFYYTHTPAWFQRYTGTDSLELSYTIETVELFLDMNLQTPEDLLRVSLSDGISIRNLSVAQLLVEKGLVPTQSDLDHFKRVMHTVMDDKEIYWGETILPSLCNFCEALSHGIDSSPLYLEFYPDWLVRAEKILDLLLGVGCSLSKRNRDGHTPLTLAIKERLFSFAEIIFKFYSPPVEVLEYLVQPLVTLSNPFEASKVWEHYASIILRGKGLTSEYVDEAVRCLVRVGIFDISGLGLIHLSNEKDVPQFRHGIVEMLLGHGVIPDLRISIWPRSSALVYHLSKKHFDLAATLLRQGADPSAPDRKGWTATHAAIARGNVSFLSDLLDIRKCTWKIDWEGQCGLTYDGQAYEGIRPLHCAALSSVDCLQAILEKVDSISLEAAAENGFTAVHFAVVGRKISAVEILHDRGANINARSVDGQLALHIAVAKGYLTAVERLLELGSEITPDCDGRTPLLLAYQRNDQNMIDCLRDHDQSQRGVVPAGMRSAALAKGVFRAIQAGNLSSCQEIFASLPTVDIDIPAIFGALTALGVALLVDNGANLEAKDNLGRTPLLLVTTAPATIDNSVVIQILLQAGSNINCRDNTGATPMAEACERGNSLAISALMDWDPDMLVKDHKGRNVLHYLFCSRETNERDSCRPALFIKFTQMGVRPSEVDMFGCSALHLSMHNKCMTALLLNGNAQIQDERPIPWSSLFLNPYAVNAACLITAFRLYRRKLSTQKFRTLLNLEVVGPRNPLCFAASRGQIQAMGNILSLGSLIDFEGCPEGSALMAASSAGTLESVIYLVRHGASISFQGHNHFRSAVKLAATSPRVLRWLLVDRFTDQKKLDQFCHESTSLSTCLKPWSGIHKAEMVISGQWERQPYESSQQYWARLSNMTKDFRGKFLPPNSGKTTRRQSKLVPSESVKIAADGYFVPYDASVGERVTRKSKWSELSLEVRECLERFCL
ncbi:hypothetical protein CLIM01_02441 [Colletotrichum limetticola]|uniref:Nephrocystin 3-like N-terminal domain-containing protein n=1 Tax=Colletotrichum limetticola TaxID=1209924 RepID=A0ABQ9Q971_9PEZI|nr:hypothetical protein CLIM01_02441 [Colletotrichum limetticola]